MSSSEDDFGAPPPAKVLKGKQTLEKIYQRKTQVEHIILRPDSYIGSVQPTTEGMYIYKDNKIEHKSITYVPGLYKIFDEILVNAADNKQRDKKMDTIKIDISPEKNEIMVYNNGKGIPVAKHKEENMFIPTLIFGHLLTSSNFDDEEQKVTGGRNGYGAKLCNVFSTKFTVETASKEYKKIFKQVWTQNMSTTTEPKVTSHTGEDFTKITFSPDLAKFNMESLDEDTISLLSRRAYDIAASTKGVKVYLNGERVKVKGFKDYVDFFLKSHATEGEPELKPVFEVCGERWEVAVALSEDGFRQMSFVNSIATTKGGRHIDHVCDLISKSLVETINKKNKGGLNIKPFQIKNHMWLFVNCLIINPTFDSQTKENMTLQVKSFGSKCSFTDKFFNQLSKSGIVESVLSWSKFQQDKKLKTTSGKKTSKLKGVPKLEDANDAGTKNSMACTLILTEGDSAKTLAVSGLSVVGRDRYGVFPLRGKLLNVREATHKQLMENKEINDLVKIMGLTYKKKYDTPEDKNTLRYGKLMIMTDQDQDGSHIKGLLINFIQHNWPSLLKIPFLEQFITPIVKVSKGNVIHSFFSIPEFTEWKEATPNWTTYKVKYYKGLGTSTSKEAKEYFADMNRHRILFHYGGAEDDQNISKAFSKKAIEDRKDWLTNWMEDSKKRKALGLPVVYLYEKNTKSVSYSDFVNKELVLFSNMDNERSIPSLVDGLKPGQRKVLFTCLKRNDKREVKVAQLAGSVGEMSAYHHGEASLMGTIINLAQNFVGSNNINLLQPIGQFGTRLAGGKDHASPRYIFTKLSPLTRLIFHPLDDPIMHYLKDDNLKVEPQYYVPIIPMILVNGADGIGTGWMTRIPNFNPRDIIQNLLRILDGKEPVEMVPFFKGFTGTIESIGEQKYVINGEVANISDTKIEITELPIRVWTQAYKENTMELFLNGNEKVSEPTITNYKEYHTDTTVRFLVSLEANKLKNIESKGIHQFFKLQTTLSTSSMVLFDSKGVLRKYNSPGEILKEFYEVRLKTYEKRKAYLVGMLEAESRKLKNQARFIKMMCSEELIVQNKKRKLVIKELIDKNFDSDPTKAWEKSQLSLDDLEENEPTGSDDEEGSLSSKNSDDADSDFDYLLKMAILSLTQERKEDLLKRAKEKQAELDLVIATSEKEMWKSNLKELLSKLEEVEEKERQENQKSLTKSVGSSKGGKNKKVVLDIMPSPQGIRVAPRIDPELRTKVSKALASKERKKVAKKNASEASEDIKDEFDAMIEKPAKKSKVVKEKVKTTPKKKSAAKTKAVWSSGESNNDSDSEKIVNSEPRNKRVKRNVEKVSKYYEAYENSENSTDNSDMEW